jgi:stage II sporulation protein D
VNRAEFSIGLAGLGLSARAMLDQDDVGDPAVQTSSQALRVLLGDGDAQALDAGTFVFEGRRYRGEFTRDNRGQVVSTVSLEQYLYSVVSREMPHGWPDAALQAQAILARTFVLQRSNPQRAYDVIPSEADQVYTGIDAERPQTTAAVNATAGQVMRFEGGFAQAMYSSCCGGHTESNAMAWGGKPVSYLCGVRCTYCTDSPWYSWTRDIAIDELQQALAAQLGAAGAPRSIALDPPDGSGRAPYWTFTGDSGSVRIKAEAVRTALGTRRLPSLLVRSAQIGPPAKASPICTIEGGGLGHGVGLCQWGARGMARGGAGARAILAYYFPGTGIGHD